MCVCVSMFVCVCVCMCVYIIQYVDISSIHNYVHIELFT